MNGILKVARFQFRDQRNAIAIFYGIIVGLATMGVFAILRDPSGGSSMGGLGLTSVIFIFILGLNCFTTAFRFMQANNVSRQRFYMATIVALSAISLFMATIDTTLGFILRSLIPYSGMTEQLYGTASFLPEVLWTFTLAAFAAHLGWFISMVYYRSSKLQKVVVSLSPLFGLVIAIYIDRRTSGTFGTAIMRFLGTALGFLHGRNPYVASLSFTVGAAIMAGLCFLLIRRAPVKD